MVEGKVIWIKKLILICLVGFMPGLWNVVIAEPRDPGEYFFEQTLGDLSEDLAEARDQGKAGVLLFFEQKDCPFCYRMKTTVLNQSEVQEYFRKYFLVLPIDIEGSDTLTDFQGVDTTPKAFFAKVARNRGATPVFAIFDLNGKMVVRYTGATSGVEEFMWLGEYAVKEKYKQMPFARYKREKKKAKAE